LRNAAAKLFEVGIGGSFDRFSMRLLHGFFEPVGSESFAFRLGACRSSRPQAVARASARSLAHRPFMN
jgi:hypothetical protein